MIKTSRDIFFYGSALSPIFSDNLKNFTKVSEIYPKDCVTDCVCHRIFAKLILKVRYKLDLGSRNLPLDNLIMGFFFLDPQPHNGFVTSSRHMLNLVFFFVCVWE